LDVRIAKPLSWIGKEREVARALNVGRDAQAVGVACKELVERGFEDLMVRQPVIELPEPIEDVIRSQDNEVAQMTVSVSNLVSMLSDGHIQRGFLNHQVAAFAMNRSADELREGRK